MHVPVFETLLIQADKVGNNHMELDDEMLYNYYCAGNVRNISVRIEDLELQVPGDGVSRSGMNAEITHLDF